MAMAKRLFVFLFTILLYGQVQGQMRPVSKTPFNKFDSTKTENFFFEIKRVNRVKPDSAIAYISYGKKDGLFKGATGTIFTTRVANEKNNNNTRETAIYLGNAEVIAITDSSAAVKISVYNKFLDEKIYGGDLVELSAYTMPGIKKNIFYELAKLNILFLDNNRQPIFTIADAIRNTNPDFETDFMQLYTDEILDFKDDVEQYIDSSLKVPHTKGPFKGRNLVDMFKTASYYDLNSFFHFVRKYPGKYMGNEWKINETFATWVINYGPQGERNREWLLPLIEKTNIDQLGDLVKKSAAYIQSDSLIEWTERVNALQTEEKNEAALQLCNKLIFVAKALKNTVAEHEFYYTRSFLAEANGDSKAALADVLKAYSYNPKHINYRYQLASLYGKAEQFDKCFQLYDELLKELPGNINITGNYGWYKLYAGKVDEAIPFCRTAYFGDTTNVAFTVNYAHTFLIKGNTDSARYYYQKTLDNLYSPADYTTGPKTDFDFLFKKGWNRKAVAEMADWMDKEFEEKYYAITKGNETWKKARQQYDEKNYKAATSLWKEYITLYDKSKEPPVSSIHNAHNWIGVSYYYARMYDSALYHYQAALKIAREKLSLQRNIYTTGEDDYTVSDYDRIYNFYTNTGNKTKAEQYKILYNAELQKVTELYATPALHIIALNGSSRPGEYSGKNNAGAFFHSISGIKDKENQKSFNKLVNGSEINREKLTGFIDLVRINSKPEDIFVFYYSGENNSSNGQHYLDFNTKDTTSGRIAITELMDHIDLVYANKKMVITDLPNPSLLNLITTKYANTGNNSAEIIFLSPGIETPVQENGVSLFTNQLALSLNNLKEKGSFTAKDFIDKASFAIGRGEHYLPVLSFTNSKDFVLFENEKNDSAATINMAGTRGLIVKENATSNNDPAVTGSQKNYALLFATDNYMDAGFNKLVNPINDATALESLLINEFGFEVKLVKNPSKDDIEKWLSEYRDNKSYGPNDQLLIFFAGHGVYYDKAKMGYLVAKDSRVDDQTHKTYLSYSDLGNIYLKNISCNRIFLVLDACFAGSFFDNNTVRGTPDVDAKNLSTLMKNASNKRFYKGISSGGKQYVADGKPGQHSPFAGSFLNVLFNKAMNKSFVTADEIIGEIKSNPPASTAICEGNFHYSDPFSHFIFELKRTEKVSTIKKDEQKQ